MAARYGRPRRRCGPIPWGVGALLGLVAGACASRAHGGERAPVADTVSDRVLKRFTFTEPDNYNPVPKYWVPFRSLPSFTVGRFDPVVGHDAPPSFYLGLNGRDVAYRYLGSPHDPQVRPDSDYQIVAWIKPDRLITARACLSAFYIDREGNPIPGTQVFGPLVGGPSLDRWQQVTLHLPAGPEEAQSIGLTVRVAQERTWRDFSSSHRYVEPTDVHGGAWFDDIVIHRLPRARLSTPAPGNVWVQPKVPVLEAEVTDSDPVGLTASLELVDASGALVQAHPVPIGTGSNVAPTLFSLPELPPGLYRATLEVRAGEDGLVARYRTFACLAELSGVGGARARIFGVTLDQPGLPDDQLALLSVLGVGTVKLTLWGASSSRPGFDDNRPALDRVLHDLVKSRVALVGVLAGPPRALVHSAGDAPRPLLDILGDDPAGWRQSLADVVAPYASVFRSWQIGGDGDPTVIDADRQRGALRAVRDELRTLITTPDLTAPASAHVAAEGSPLPAEDISLAIDDDVQPGWIADHLRSYPQAEHGPIGVYLTPGSGTHDRVGAMGSLAKRVLCARHAGAAPIVLPELWTTRSTIEGVMSEPIEEFIVYRTIVGVLGDARPGPTLSLAPGVQCLAFDGDAGAILALWDETAPPQGRTYAFQFGAATRSIDLWGRTQSLDRGEDGRHTICLSPVPLLVDHVDPWLVELLSRLKLSPSEVEFHIGSHRHVLTVAAPARQALAGTVSLIGPPTWEIRPHRLPFSLPPGGVLEMDLDIRYAHNEPAGDKEILAKVEVDSAQKCFIEVPLRFRLGLSGIEVWAFATRQGDRLIVRHAVSNHSAVPASFRGFAAAPGRTRQYRVYANLQPGDTVVKEYHFSSAATLSGRELRVGLREVGGTRSHNLEIIAP